MITLPIPSTSVFFASVLTSTSFHPEVQFFEECDPERVLALLFLLPWSLFPSPCFFTLHPVKLPSAHDRGDCSATLNVVVIESEIHMNDDERNKKPQEKVMPVANAHFAAHQRHNPNEHPRQPRTAHA